MKKIFLLTLFTFFLTLNFYAQRNCAAMHHLDEQMQDDPKLEHRMQQIEQATREYLKKNESQRMEGIITIPVVFHVVYNTAAENLPEAQLQTQLDIINEDFRRLNADASNTPSVFTGVAADAEFEFCLATVDPQGVATTGITRTQTNVTSFAYSGNPVKFDASGGKDAWPAADYLNIWVCDLEGGLLGYAQFPGGAAATDGVVNDYLYTGGPGQASPPFDRGRTLTHEIGHYLNLRHIWGDTGCGGDDFVTDTPLAGSSNTTGSPCTFPGPNTCDEGVGDLPDMFQNYMDYSDDECMNLFTLGQKARMRAIFEPGGFRESLLTSNACGTPADPTCDDGVQNGQETGVDCGGPDCPDCPPDPTCDDGIQNGDEEGVDCGGSECAPCPCEGTFVNISITFDDYPEETSWSLVDANGVTVASGGTYGGQADGSTLSIDECLADGCYDFTIFDAYGDGICCAYGNGSYTVSVGNTTVASGGSFGASETTNFCIGDVEPTCDDGIQNGDEEGIDCGGSECAPCPPDPTCDDGIQNGDEEGVDCGGSECAPCAPCVDTDVDDEDFEAGFGIWNDGGSDCARASNANYANSGTRSIRLRDNSSTSVTTTDNLALDGFEEVTIDFTYMARSMETNEDFFLEASVDGGSSFTTLTSWVKGADFQNNSREFETVVITGTFTDQTQFRFRCDASTNSDFIFLDDIVITGCSNNNGATREPAVESLASNKIAGIKVFPNPTLNTLNIEYNVSTDTQIQINVIDMAGRRLMTNSEKATSGLNTSSMQVGDLNAGIYYVHINNGDEQIVRKFVVIK